ncbi:uncharacterized protein LOC130428905 [Triplophysa dalaica]|uniref:uncharacterized protein LOC130428905 n=1 Tax=Triplophysa dalaica TaxID=1582913 RepID=UPI0024DFE97C|nr:uncharacterized protein LOC130428905 [Triplophysa dalaica]
MAYITSGSKPPEFMKSFHLAISALSMQLFHHSFTEDQRKQQRDEDTQEAFGTIVEDFLSVKVPAETHFAEHMLAERQKVYKYFKLEQLLTELKPTLKEKHAKGRRTSSIKTPIPGPCVEKEINNLDEVYQELSSKLDSLTEKNTPKLDKPLQYQNMMVELQKCTVEQRLKEMKERFSKLSSRQRMGFKEDKAAHSKIQAQKTASHPANINQTAADQRSSHLPQPGQPTN